MWDLGIWIWLVLVMQWRRCPYDSLFDFVRFGFLVFCSCTFHICIFPRPQTAHSANICKQLCGCVSCAHPCVQCACSSVWIWTVDILCFLNRTKGMQNATSCTKLSNVSHIKWMKRKKGKSWFFSVSFRLWFLFSCIEIEQSREKTKSCGKKHNKWSRKSDSFW